MGKKTIHRRLSGVGNFGFDFFAYLHLSTLRRVIDVLDSYLNDNESYCRNQYR